jgi:hypothetical protein
MMLNTPRRASVLLLALIVIVLLTLGAMTFFDRMFVEHQASLTHIRQTQTRYLAESGMEYIRAIAIQDPATLAQSGGTYDNPTLFQGKLVIDDELAAFRGRFTILAPALNESGYYAGVRYGLENESSRLNLNTLIAANSGREDGPREALLALPGMTEPIADAILDWIDPDDEQRLLGAEQEYYSSLNPPYVPRNGPLGSIEELLLVRDVTPALLFGADRSRNALIEADEQPFTVIEGVDNSTGLLNRGWAAYLTLDSAERNTKPDGTLRIDINMGNLRTLHETARQVLSEEMANYIIAYRQGGRNEGEPSGRTVSAASLTPDFETPANVRIETLLDLVGGYTMIVDDEQSGERASVESPFTDDSSAMRDYLPKLLDNFTTNSAPSIPGRLNINQAPRPLLSGIAGLDANAVSQIVASRRPDANGERPDQAYETWILTDGIVDLEQMRRLMPLITAGGNVYRAQVVGYFDAEGPASRLEVVIDATQTTPVVRRRRELAELGPGYGPDVLGIVLDDEP